MQTRYNCKLLSMTTLLLITSIVSYRPLAAAPKYPLKLMYEPVVWGGSCEPGAPRVIAGALLFLQVSNSEDRSEAPVEPGWPAGYSIEAAADLPAGMPFVPTDGLIESFRPRCIIGMLSAGEDWKLRHNSGSEINSRLLNMKDIVLEIPEDMVGHTVTLRARYRRGDSDLASKPSGPLSIIAPCDRGDTARIITTRIYEAWQTRQYDRAIAAADSMLSNGLSDAMAWTIAGSAARGANRPDRAIAYLNRLYEDFDVVAMDLGGEPPPRYSGGSRNPEMEQAYQSLHQQLLDEQAIKEQQQR